LLLLSLQRIINELVYNCSLLYFSDVLPHSVEQDDQKSFVDKDNSYWLIEGTRITVKIILIIINSNNMPY
jgi:hypothetical protein